MGWGVPPAHTYNNDGRSNGSAVRIPVLAFRHIADGEIGGVRFTLTYPAGNLEVQTKTVRTTETPTASTSGSFIVTRASGPSDQQSKLWAFFFTHDVASLPHGLYHLQAEALAADGSTVLQTLSGMSFWNNWNGLAINYVDVYADFGAGSDLSPTRGTINNPAKTVHGALTSVLAGGGKVSFKNSNTSAQFLRLHLRGSAKQLWGGSTSWSPSFGTDAETWIEVIGEGQTADGNILVQEPTNQNGGAGGVHLGNGGTVWVHFRNISVDGKWGLDYATASFADSRGWYDGCKKYPGIYATAPHIKTLTIIQTLGGFKWNYGTNIEYTNVVEMDTFNVGSDLIARGAIMVSPGRFVGDDKPFVEWGVEVPRQDSRLGAVIGTYRPFNDTSYWQQAFRNIPVTAIPMGSYLRVSIPAVSPNAFNGGGYYGFYEAAQALVGQTGVGFKLRHVNAAYTGYVSVNSNEGDWEVVNAGLLPNGDPFVDLDLRGATPVQEISTTSINLFPTLQSAYTGAWIGAGYDPHPDILETQYSANARNVNSPPLILQGYHIYDVRNAQLLFTHGSDLFNTAYVNLTVGMANNALGVMNTGTALFKMNNVIFRNIYINADWNLQMAPGSFEYTDVEFVNNIIHRFSPQGVTATSQNNVHGQFYFSNNYFEDPNQPVTAGFNQVNGAFNWMDVNHGDSGNFGSSSSAPAHAITAGGAAGLVNFPGSQTGGELRRGPWGFAVNGTNSGS